MTTRLRALRNAVLVLLTTVFTLTTTGCPLPSGALQPWNGGYPELNSFGNFQHWLVLKCAFSDDPTARVLPNDLDPAIGTLDEYIDFFMTLGGIGTGNIQDYFRDVSYGMIDLQTRVYGWYKTPYASNNTLNRVQRVEQCASAAPDSDGIDFSQYDGIVIVTNKPQDGGAGYVGKGPVHIKGQTYNMGAVVFDSGSLFTAFAAHEMGHGFGLPHSYDNTTNNCGGAPGEYCDQYDIMSAMGTLQFHNHNYPGEGAEAGYAAGGAGPGMNVPNLLFFNALPDSRIVKHLIYSPVQTVTLTALSKASANLPLAVEIYNVDTPNDIFTVEVRHDSGWDQGVGATRLLIHEYTPGSSPFSTLQEGPHNGGYTAGDLYVNRAKSIIIFVSSIDEAAGTATFNINSFGN